MSRSLNVWPWVVGGVVGGGLLLAWGVAQTGEVGTRPPPGPKPPPRIPPATLFSSLDIEAGARMLASENPRGSERLHVEQIWTQLRSRKPGQTLYERVTNGSGWGKQGGRTPPGGKRPVATTEAATKHFRDLTRSVLTGQRASSLDGARKFFEPAEQDKAFAKAEAARKKRAAGQTLDDKERRLLGYLRDARAVRSDWLRTSRYVGTIEGVEFYT